MKNINDYIFWYVNQFSIYFSKGLHNYEWKKNMTANMAAGLEFGEMRPHSHNTWRMTNNISEAMWLEMLRLG